MLKNAALVSTTYAERNIKGLLQAISNLNKLKQKPQQNSNNADVQK